MLLGRVHEPILKKNPTGFFKTSYDDYLFGFFLLKKANDRNKGYSISVYLELTWKKKITKLVVS